MDEETEALLIRLLGDNSQYIQILSSSLNATQQAVEVIQREAERLAQASAAASATASTAAREVSQEEARKSKVMAEGRAVTEANMTSGEKYIKTLERMNFLLAEGAITEQTFYRATKASADKYSDRNKVMAEGQKVTRSVMTDQEKYSARLDYLINLYDKGAISAETYDRAAAAANISRNKTMQEGQKVTEGLMTATEKHKAEVGNLNGLLTNGAITQETFDRGLQRANQTLREASSNVIKLSDAVKIYIVAIGAGIAANKAWEASKRSIYLAAESESMKTQFGTFLKNEERGIQMVKDIQLMAQTTPLTNETLQTSAKTLLQFGVQGSKILPILKDIGDITGADTERMKHMSLAFGQMNQATRLMGQDLIQMVNAGFNPLKQMSKDTGKSVAVLRDEMQDGLITVEMVTTAFENATKSTGMFYDLMNKSSNTLKGMWANMKDDIDAALREIGETMVSELSLKEIVRNISNGAKSMTVWVKSMAGETKILIVVIAGVVTSLVVMTAALVAGKYVWLASIFVWSTAGEVLTALTLRLTLVAIAANALKLTLLGLAVYGAYIFYDIVSGAQHTREEMEKIKRLTDDINKNGQMFTDKLVNWAMTGHDVDERLRRVNVLLEQFKTQAMDIQGMDIGRYLTPTVTDKNGLERQKELIEQIQNRIKLLKDGGYDELIKLQKQYYDLGFKKTIRKPDASDDLLDPNGTKYTTMTEVIDFENRMLEAAKANAAMLSVRKGRLDELKDELTEAASPAGQLARKLKEIKDGLKDTINFSGLDRWHKEVQEMVVLMDKLKTDPQVRGRVFEEILQLQRLAKQKELLGEIYDHIKKIREETYAVGKETEQAKYNEYLRRGADEADLRQLRFYEKELAFSKELNRLRDEGKKMTEEFKDPTEVFRDQIADLKEMLKQKFITDDTFNKGVDQATKKFNEATNAAHSLKDALDGIKASASGSAEALAKMRSFKESLSIVAPARVEDIQYDWAKKGLPKWLKNFEPKPEVPVRPNREIGNERNDQLIPLQRGGAGMADPDKDKILTYLASIAMSNENMEKKPPITLRTANL